MPPVPVAAIVVFLVRQEGPNVDMPLGLPFTRCLSVVDHSYKSVPVVPDVKDHVAAYRISILEHAANIIKTVPANRLDNGRPNFDFVRRSWVAFDCLSQMLTRNDMHSLRVLHNM